MSAPATRIVLVTGANSGVGYATSKVLITTSTTPYFHVIMTGRSLEKTQQAKAEIEQDTLTTATGTLSALQLDVTDANSVEKAAQYVEKTHGRLDALINNAASGSRDSDLVTRLRLCFETNVIGAALVAQTFRPLLLKAPNPYSIWVSSGAGSLERASEASNDPAQLDKDEAYRASKAALNMVMLCEHRDWHKKGLRSFALSPGFVVSNLRGTREEMRNPGGMAGDPIVSGETILAVLEGKRDGEAGKQVFKDGVHPW